MPGLIGEDRFREVADAWTAALEEGARFSDLQAALRARKQI